MDLLRDAHARGRDNLDRVRTQLKGAGFARVRAAAGLPAEPLVPCLDPAISYLPPDGVARRIHSDLPGMLMGGVASLLLQLLHPGAMAGVDQFSNYRTDPLGRLGRTAMFIGAVSFGSDEQARQAVAIVHAVHARVQGVAADGTPFRANDPHLLGWVHAAELAMFLEGYRAFGPTNLTKSDADRYVGEMAKVALDLGVLDPPRSTAALTATLERYRPELRLTDAGKQTRNFVLRGVGRRLDERLAYATIASGALSLLPRWARSQLHLPKAPFGESLVLRPSAFALGMALRWTLPDLPTASG